MAQDRKLPGKTIGLIILLIVACAAIVIVLFSFSPLAYLNPASAEPTGTLSPGNFLSPTPPISIVGTSVSTHPPPETAVPGGEHAIAVQTQLAKVDEQLNDSLAASYSYNRPEVMTAGEATTIEFLLNPSVEPTALATEITGTGPVESGIIQVTNKMRAELHSDGTFTIVPWNVEPDQFISNSETTRWGWDVTPQKGGKHRLTLIVSRLIQIDGQDNWRPVKSYVSDINVVVSTRQLIADQDWKWLAGIIIASLLIPAFWRWIDQRDKKKAKGSGSTSQKKTGK